MRSDDRTAILDVFNTFTDSHRSPVIQLLEDIEYRDTCPLAALLALAIRDGALTDLKSIEDLQSLRYMSGETVLRLQNAPEKEDMPVFLNCSLRKQQSSEASPLTLRRFETLHSQLLEQSGWAKEWSTASLRRGLADRVSTVTSERSPQDSHGSVLASLVSAQPREDNPIASSRRLLDAHVHNSLCHASDHYVEQGCYGQADSSLSIMHWARQSEACSQWDPWHNAIGKVYYNNLLDHRFNLEALVGPFLTILHTGHLPWRYTFTRLTESGECFSCGLTLPRSWTLQNAHLVTCFLGQQQSTAYRELQAHVIGRQCQWNGCTKDLQDFDVRSFAVHAHQHLHRGQVRCCWAECTLLTSSPMDLRMHLLLQHQVPLPDTLPESHYCYECRICVGTALEWDNHCLEHLNHIRDLYCGHLRKRGVTIMASHCVSCVGDTSLEPRKRLYQFKNLNNLHTHLAQSHLQSAMWPLACPHPLCSENIFSSNAFWTHLEACHGVPAYKPRSGRNMSVDTTWSPISKEHDLSCHREDSKDLTPAEAQGNVIVARASCMPIFSVYATEVSCKTPAKKRAKPDSGSESIKTRKKLKVSPPSKKRSIKIEDKKISESVGSEPPSPLPVSVSQPQVLQGEVAADSRSEQSTRESSLNCLSPNHDALRMFEELIDTSALNSAATESVPHHT